MLAVILSSFSLNLHAQTWNEIIKIVASDRDAGDKYGTSVSISGDIAIVGAHSEDHDNTGENNLSEAGSAYIFEFNGSTWIEQQKLVASDRGAFDWFGFSVSISGDRAIVGANQEDHDSDGENFNNLAGSAYIFHYDGTAWIEQQKLVSSDRANGDLFGISVSIDEDRAIVGADHEDHDASGGNTVGDAGAAYIFEFDGTAWIEQQKVVASDRGAIDRFAGSVCINGDRAIVGARLNDFDTLGENTFGEAGAAYIFEYNGTTWAEQQKLVASDRGSGDNFGHSVSLSGDRAIVGAWLKGFETKEGNTLFNAGAAYIFENDGEYWVEQQKIVASDKEANDRFGASVGISDDRAIVGADREGHDNSEGSTVTFAGAAYTYAYSGTTWVAHQKLVASDTEFNDEFGHSVAISGDRIIIGAHFEDHNASGGNNLGNAGSAYIFETLVVSVIEDKIPDLRIYPNPTRNALLIEVSEEVNLEIKSVMGKVMFTQTKVLQNLNLDLSTYSSGLYFIKVSNGNQTIIQKIIKE